MNRRQFIGKNVLCAVAGGAGLWALTNISDESSMQIPDAQAARGFVRPPGSGDEEQFLAKCIRCQRCVEACEPRAIRLFGSGSGKRENTPYVLPEIAGCTLCMMCGPACPTGAIETLANLKQSDMGIAIVDEQLCVSHNGTGICGACHTVCPVPGKAIKQDFRNRPVVLEDKCVGCGMCEEVCIVKRDKAIRVHSDRRWS